MTTTIGSFANVPAPGDPIKSDWPQEISTYVQAMGKGRIGIGRAGSNQTVTSPATPTDVTGVAVSFTALANRYYRAVLALYMQKTTADGYVTAQLANSGGTVLGYASVSLVNGAFGVATVIVDLAPAAGAYTIKAQVNPSTNGVLVLGGQPGTGASLYVEDMGSTAGLPA